MSLGFNLCNSDANSTWCVLKKPNPYPKVANIMFALRHEIIIFVTYLEPKGPTNASVTSNHGPRTIFITRTISCPLGQVKRP